MAKKAGEVSDGYQYEWVPIRIAVWYTFLVCLLPIVVSYWSNSDLCGNLHLVRCWFKRKRDQQSYRSVKWFFRVVHSNDYFHADFLCLWYWTIPYQLWYEKRQVESCKAAFYMLGNLRFSVLLFSWWRTFWCSNYSTEYSQWCLQRHKQLNSQ